MHYSLGWSDCHGIIMVFGVRSLLIQVAVQVRDFSLCFVVIVCLLFLFLMIVLTNSTGFYQLNIKIKNTASIITETAIISENLHRRNDTINCA